MQIPSIFEGDIAKCSQLKYNRNTFPERNSCPDSCDTCIYLKNVWRINWSLIKSESVFKETQKKKWQEQVQCDTCITWSFGDMGYLRQCVQTYKSSISQAHNCSHSLLTCSEALEPALTSRETKVIRHWAFSDEN